VWARADQIQRQYPEPDETLFANPVEIDSTIAWLTGQLDEVLAPLLKRLPAAPSEEAEAKPAEQAA
jgi:hypothetical protein